MSNTGALRPPMQITVNATRRTVRGVMLLGIAASLLAGIFGGLLRAGVPLAWPHTLDWSGYPLLAHAFLMMVGFMGTVIGIERAVATKAAWAFAAPLASALAALSMLAGAVDVARWLAVAAAAVFTVVNLDVFSRQRADHTALLLVGALVWFIGNLLYALNGPVATVAPWWFSFLIVTIAAERLEMTRLMRRRRGASGALHIGLLAMLAGSALSVRDPASGGMLYGLSLIGLALWLSAFDIARRTVRAEGLSRYMAVCLLGGYAWLALAGAAWMATAFGLAARDMALHALGLGFVFSMMLGHAPVILPALTRVKVLFGRLFYLPVAVLHGSLLLRLVGGLHDPFWLRIGAIGNVAAIVLFALTMAGAAWAWRARHSSQSLLRHGHASCP